ncbi:adenylyltransferase/cytidyltransferase family protein [Candidatus Thiosymbion oneisti]|uniref:adenylyltransferase/cytidyltransferase family protein n=1 Tax=Candidatus Thiosymbion oneisti TaxID=589554 RepID=UPI0013FD5122|nr:adenylyltransferase/cytidyltransferase family protein [Candidatus Thiosymbion oneisti]
MALLQEHGVIVRGEFALVDAFTVRYLQNLARRHGRVFVAPDRALLAPAVGMSDLRYLLSRLSCVAGVLETACVVAPGIASVTFPIDANLDHIRSMPTPASLDEPVPPGCSMAELLTSGTKPLVLLTGCFDLIHAGHARLIEAATAYGPTPVVAMLTSRGISAQPKNRGDRPLWRMVDRLAILRALRIPLRCVFFDGPDSRALIHILHPDYWVKEIGDRARPIVQEEAGLLESLGGQVVWIANESSSSSTEIARAIKKLSAANDAA